MIRFEGAVKRFGDKTALADLSLEIPAGTLFALVGPNGAGKTTAIGLLTGLLAPSGGRTFLSGIDVARDPVAAKARLGFVPDRPYLWPKWTPRETLRFVGAVFGRRGAELENRIDEELGAFDLEEFSSQRNETLSHGTRQRVALAQAFLHDPEVLVLDEPMVGLDPLAQRGLTERLQAHAAAGAAVLLTTHQLALAEEIATVAGLLVEGRLVARGNPRRLVTAAGRTGTLSEIFFDLAGGTPHP
ncbi:MAG: ABC transporter ATP-binding protein [Thermoanaerobaculia bacterium]|nr:ABC transporter ATP-binding protein [Thermoanaerobaculia bacterium]